MPLEDLEQRVAAWSAWSSDPGGHRIWRTRAPMRSGDPAPKRARALASLPLLTCAWAWDAEHVWARWGKVDVASLMTDAEAHRVVWRLWMRALDMMSVDHGGVGVYDSGDILLPASTRAALRGVVARIDLIGDDGWRDEAPDLLPRLASDVITLATTAVAAAQLDDGASTISPEASQIILPLVRAETHRLALDVGRAHLLGAPRPTP